MSLKIRKIFNIKENLQEFTQYIGCNHKGIYYIESNTIANKPIRYFLFLRKKGYNINDRIIEEELVVSATNLNLKKMGDYITVYLMIGNLFKKI